MFLPNHRMLNSYAFASSRIKIKCLDSTKIKEKKSLHTLYSQKKKIFSSKNHKNKAFWPNIRNSKQVCIIAYESRNIEMTNSEETKNLSKFFLISF